MLATSMRTYVLALLLVLSIMACSKKEDKPTSEKTTETTKFAAPPNTLVHAYIADLTLNPIIQNESNSREFCEMIYPKLMQETFDTALGLIVYQPLFATRWEVRNNNREIVFTLRRDVKWTDGQPVTARDWLFSYELYADSVIASVRQNFISENFLQEKDGTVNLKKAVDIPNDSTLIVRFRKPMPVDLMCKYTNLPFIAEHIWKDVKREEFRKSEFNRNPEKLVGCGPYKVEKWVPNSECVLVANKSCNLPAPPKIERIVNRVVQESTTRLTMLRTGEADVVQGIPPEEAEKMRKENPNVQIIPRGQVVFLYIGWMNIDPVLYKQSKKVQPHPLFGSKKVRQALTYAINRQEYLDGFLRGYGELGVTDVVPLCYWARDPELKPYPHDIEKAKSLLAEEGWKKGSDGILEKNGRKFSFKLTVNKGNKGREFLAVLVQKNLKDVGIDCQIETMESNVMSEKMRNRELDAFIAGFIVAPPDVDPSEIRLSDLERTPYNFTGFQNKRVDELINLAKAELQILNTAKYWKEYQKIIYDEQPETIVTWGSPLVGVSKRIKKAVITPVANFDCIWEWEMEGGSVAEKR
ncbi:MAG: ABC transporter substrate-binding protein [Candidatus Thermochlorobacter aerophilum]|uniref:ABC transporter substrate-binding protein n=1 Tax=Candidatus Thermochlorobacter aerophilus TaxID=1868324 RepID=A0A395M0V7_9BACT|nr:MAG: ABC transporter substrate-binding protein [Candidatus Thermochlorobacter aerophilum]